MRLRLPVIVNANDDNPHFDDEVWRRAAAAICARHRLSFTSLRRSPQGENIIFFVDETFVVKIFAPFHENYSRETSALEFAHGKISIATPEVLYTGEVDGWSYIVMNRLAGHASREVWASVGRRNRFEIIARLGSAMKELHTHDAPSSQSALNRNWRGFIEGQVRTSLERQKACGANPEWLERLPAYFAAHLNLLPADDEPVFLHGDIHAGNLLLAEKSGRWHITGLIDFGDSLRGFHEYEFVAPGVLMVQGDGELQRTLLLAYGYTETQLDVELRQRLMLLTILYECSDLRKYARRLAPEAVHLTLDQLERAIWAFTAE